MLRAQVEGRSTALWEKDGMKPRVVKSWQSGRVECTACTTDMQMASGSKRLTSPCLLQKKGAKQQSTQIVLLWLLAAVQ